MLNDPHLEVELKFERLVHQSRMLSVFRRNPSTWELLLRLAAEDENGLDGIYHAIEQLETRYLGSSAMLKFVRERRDDGLIEFKEHSKRSKWRVTLEPSLREELLSTLAWRNGQLLSTGHRTAPHATTANPFDFQTDTPRKASNARD